VMKRLTILALANALLLIVLTSGAANAQFNLVHTAMINGVAGTPFTVVPPATVAVTVSSVHTAEIEYTGTGTTTASCGISMRLYVDSGNVTYDIKNVNQPSTIWMHGDAYYIDGFFVSGTSGTLQSTLSGTNPWGVGTYTTKAFTQVVLNGVPTKTDATPGSFVVQP
jgi:hypothetical protein